MLFLMELPIADIIWGYVGLISFDVEKFTGYARRPEANVRFHQVTSIGNFIAKLKAAFSMPQLAPALA